jgi:putative oxidoreductase
MLNRPLPAPFRDIALLIGRIVLGVVLFAHGWQKLMINGIAGTYGQFEKLGIPLAIVSASFTSFVEFVGGALLIAGALTTTVIALDLVVMVGAAGFVHLTHGIFAQNGGWELVGVIVAAELALAATGPGRFSVDHLISSRRAREEMPVATPRDPAPADGAFGASADPVPQRRDVASQFARLSPEDTGPITIDPRPRPAPRPTTAQQVAIANVASRPEGATATATATERLQHVPPAARPVVVADPVAETGPRSVVEPDVEAPATHAPEPVAVAPLFEPSRPLVDAQPAFGPRRTFDAPRPAAMQVPLAAPAPVSVQRPGELPQRVRRTERVGPTSG